MAVRGLSAHALSVRAGLAGGHVGHLLSGRIKGTQVETLRAIALAGGCSLQWLTSGEGESGLDAVDTEPARRPVFGDLPGWQSAETEARRRYPGLPPFAFQRARETAAVHPPRTVTAEFAADLARVWMRHASEDDLVADATAAESAAEAAKRQ